MVTIKYEKIKMVTEENVINIEDTHDCFLCGKEETYGRETYLGIYVGTDDRLHAVVVNGGCITLNDSMGNHNIYTDSYIRDFCKKNRNVHMIERVTFENELRNTIKRIAIE